MAEDNGNLGFAIDIDIEQFNVELERAKASIDDFTSEMIRRGKEIDNALSELRIHGADISSTEAAIKSLKEILADSDEVVKSLISDVAELTEKEKKLGKQVGTYAERKDVIEQLNAKMKLLAQAEADRARNQSLLNTLEGDTVRRTEEATAAMINQSTAVSQLGNIFKKSGSPLQAFRATMIAVRSAVKLVGNETKDAQPSFKDLMKSLKEDVKSAPDTFKKLGATLKNLPGAFIKVTTAVKTFAKALLANPIGLVVASLAALAKIIQLVAKNHESLAQKQIKVNDAQKARLDLLQKEQELVNKGFEKRTNYLKRELALLEATNGSLRERYALQWKIKQLELTQAKDNAANYQEDIDNLDELQDQYKDLLKALELVKNRNSRVKGEVGGVTNPYQSEDGRIKLSNISGKTVSVKIDGELFTRGKENDVEKMLEETADLLKTRIDNAQKAKEAEEAAAHALEMEVAQRNQAAIQLANTERDEQQKTIEMRNAGIADSYAREIANIKAGYEYQRKCIADRLEQEKEVLSEIQKKELESQQELLKQREKQELARAYHAEKERQKTLQRQIEDAAKKTGPKTELEQRAELEQEYERKKEDAEAQKYEASATRIKLLNELKLAYDEQYAKEVELLEQKLYQERLDRELDAINLRLEAVKEGTVEEFELRKQAIEKNREAELAANKALAADRQQSEADINAKYNKQQKDLLESTLKEYRTYNEILLENEKEYQNKRATLIKAGASKAQLDIFDRQHAEEQDRLLDSFIGKYKSFVDQLEDYNKEYYRSLDTLQSVLDDPNTDPATKSRIQRSIKVLKDETRKGLLDIRRNIVENSISFVFSKATFDNVSDALKQLDIILTENDTLEKFRLSPYGNEDSTKEEWQDFINMVENLRGEVTELQQGFQGLGNKIKEAFKKATGDDVTKMKEGGDYLVSCFNELSNLSSKIAEDFATLATATGSGSLAKFANAMSHISENVDAAASAAGTAASVSGGNGYAIAGAAIGGGLLNIIKQIAEENNRKDEQDKVWQQQGLEYLQGLIDSTTNIVSAVDSVNNTISSLNYEGYRSSLLSAINALRSETYDNAKTWDALYRNVNTGIAWSTLDDAHLLELAKQSGLFDTASNYRGESGNDLTMDGQVVRSYFGQMIDLLDKIASGIALTSEERDTLVSLLSSSAQGRDTIRTTYANQQNQRNYELDLKRLELLREINELYKSGSIDTIRYYDTLQKLDQYNLQRLLLQREELLRSGESLNSEAIIAIDNQIAELQYSMADRLKSLFEGLTGTDLQSVVNKWLDIFRNFGDNVSGAFEKIDENIDDMMRNMIVNMMYVQPLIERLQNIIANAGKRNLGSISVLGRTIDLKVDDPNATTEDKIHQIIEQFRNEKENSADLYQTLLEELNNAGLGWGANDRTGSSRGIAQASQESIDELNGRATAIQGHTFNISENSNIMRENIAAMSGNVALIRDYTAHLVRMDADLHSMRTTLNDIQQQGVPIQ